MAEKQKVPWYSYAILVFHLTWSIGIILMTASPELPVWLKWAITGGFIAISVTFGIIDKVTADDGSRDATPFDKWTIAHTLAGVVFGIWYVPLMHVVILVFVWECFEFSVVGFGETEVILNRVVDMGVAVVGWLAVVFVVIGAKSTSFPVAAFVADEFRVAQQSALTSPDVTLHHLSASRAEP